MQNAELRSERLDRPFWGSITHVGLMLDPFENGEKGKPSHHFMDQWIVLLANKEGEQQQSFDYYTGIGHRKLLPERMRRYDQFRGNAKVDILRQSDGHDSMKKKAAIEYDSRPVAPKLDGVLYCLVMDSYAADVTFAEWCHEFGYDTDSIRARETYDACQKNADKLRRLAVNLKKAREAFQDY